MAAFRTSQLFFDECCIFYGDGFNNCLKQVAAIYPNPDLNLSQITIDNTVPSTPGDPDAVIDEADDSIHTVEDEVREPEARTVDKLPLKNR